MNDTARPGAAQALQATLALALRCFGERRFADAEALYRRVLADFPEHSDALNMLGVVMAEAGNPLQAIKFIDSAIRANPGNAAYHTNRGEVLRRWGLIEEGLESCLHAARLDPASAEVRNNLGLALLGKGAFADALPHIRAAIALRASMPQAYFNLGRALKGLGEWNEALGALRTAVSQSPSFAEAWYELATVQERLEDPSASIRSCEQALGLRADLPEFWVAKGDAHTALGDIGQAIDSYRAALARAPQYAIARYQLSLALLGSGAYAEGWQQYESRSDPTIPGAVTAPMMPMPAWQGEEMPGGRLLVLTEQGYGDHMQFARFVPRLAQRGIEVVLGASPEMGALSSTLPGVSSIVTQVEAAWNSKAQYWTFVGSLPLRLDIGAHNLAMEGPYLGADTKRVEYWRARLGACGAQRKVGLVWAGRAAHGNDWRRSIALRRFERLFKVQDTAFVSLQTGPRANDIDTLASPARIVNLGPELRDFADTAALLGALDLLISVDSAPVHLAGALGMPVWNLVSCVPDWRWRGDADISRWYPSMRLFRQSRPGDWEEVIERVALCLEGQGPRITGQL
jgi:tetratricopeptide (TPR) repeat protein